MLIYHISDAASQTIKLIRKLASDEPGPNSLPIHESESGQRFYVIPDLALSVETIAQSKRPQILYKVLLDEEGLVQFKRSKHPAYALTYVELLYRAFRIWVHYSPGA